MILPLCLFRLVLSERGVFHNLRVPVAGKSIPFVLTMIIFNTKKAAEHYVKWCQKTKDYSNDGYDWSTQSTYIEDNLVKVRSAGDGCGCGCDNHLYDYTQVIGRIKAWNDKTIRDRKISQIDKTL